MQYQVVMDIDLPRDRVVELFDSAENLYEWQPTLVSIEHQSGEPGQVGAKAKLLYKMGKRDVEMIETITKRDLPLGFDGTYEAKGVWNFVSNRFEEQGPDKTRWTVDTEFRCTGFMRLMALFPPMFKKQTRQFMQQFKEFAESQPVEAPAAT